jgi:hypothetical protein
MPSNPCHPSTHPSPVTFVSTTRFQQLPQSHQQQLAYLVATLIRGIRMARQSKERYHEC